MMYQLYLVVLRASLACDRMVSIWPANRVGSPPVFGPHCFEPFRVLVVHPDLETVILSRNLCSLEVAAAFSLATGTARGNRIWRLSYLTKLAAQPASIRINVGSGEHVAISLFSWPTTSVDL